MAPSPNTGRAYAPHLEAFSRCKSMYLDFPLVARLLQSVVPFHQYEVPFLRVCKRQSS
jgi:hypothetical protein